jgi:plastocyanin
MRRSLLFLALAVVAVLAAACTSSTAPSWTYAAPTSPPPSQPAASGSAAPASEAPAGSPSSSGGAGIGTVQISANNIAFEQATVSAPAGTAFVISFNNKEAQPHNIQIKDASGNSMFKGDIVMGPKQVDYQVPALPAGTYTFVCDVHPNMTGTLTAGS